VKSADSLAAENEMLFERAAIAAGGARVSDELPRNTNLGKNADFVFRDENVIAELKCLVHDPRDAERFKSNIDEKFKKWVIEGKIPPFFGTVVANLRDLPLECALETISLLKKPFNRLIAEANKQIKSTKRLLAMPNARGLLILIQSGDYFVPPNTIFDMVNRCLPDRYNRSVDDIIHANADMPAIQPANGNRHAFFFHACRDVQNPIPLQLVDRLQHCWQVELEQRIGGKLRRVREFDPAEIDTMVYPREPIQRPLLRLRGK
jgi:hypothetical protein